MNPQDENQGRGKRAYRRFEDEGPHGLGFVIVVLMWAVKTA